MAARRRRDWRPIAGGPSRRRAALWPCADGREVGVIAGQVPLGLGRFFGRISEASDGTVAVAETRIAGLAGHVTVRASHSGLLFSATAAEQAIAFLRSGRFRQPVG